MQFALLVARTLGRTLSELDDTMSVDEFRLWAHEYERMPWGDIRNVAFEMQFAEFAACWINAHSRKGTSPVKPQDLLKLQTKLAPIEQSYSEISSFVRAVNG